MEPPGYRSVFKNDRYNPPPNLAINWFKVLTWRDGVRVQSDTIISSEENARMDSVRPWNNFLNKAVFSGLLVLFSIQFVWFCFICYISPFKSYILKS